MGWTHKDHNGDNQNKEIKISTEDQQYKTLVV